MMMMIMIMMAMWIVRFLKKMDAGNYFTVNFSSKERNQNITPKTATAIIVDTAFKHRQLICLRTF